MELIWAGGPVARADLASQTGLNGASVTRLTRDLEELGLIEEGISRVGSRGRPTQPVTVKADGAFSAGVYFSHKTMRVGLLDLAGNLLGWDEITLQGLDPDSVARSAGEALDKIIARAGVSRARIVGTGVSVPGYFAAQTPYLAVHPRFSAFLARDVAKEFEGYVPGPVRVSRDAVSAALGERMHGIARAMDDFVFIHLGHGVGGGVFCDGRPLRGAFGNAGGIGDIFAMSERRPSGEDLLQTLNAAGAGIEDFGDLDHLDPSLTPILGAWIDHAAAQLKHGLKITARLLDPSHIIVGGRLPQPVIVALVAKIGALEAPSSYTAPLAQPVILASTLGSNAGLIGSATWPLFDAFFSASIVGTGNARLDGRSEWAKPTN